VLTAWGGVARSDARADLKRRADAAERVLGRALQLEVMKAVLKASETMLLKLRYDEPLKVCFQCQLAAV